MGLLKLRIVPNAKRSVVVGEYGDAVKVRIAAPAVDGKANAALLEFVAVQTGVPTRDVSLAAGEESRDKLIASAGMEAAEALRRLIG